MPRCINLCVLPLSTRPRLLHRPTQPCTTDASGSAACVALVRSGRTRLLHVWHRSARERLPLLCCGLVFLRSAALKKICTRVSTHLLRPSPACAQQVAPSLSTRPRRRRSRQQGPRSLGRSRPPWRCSARRLWEGVCMCVVLCVYRV